MHTVLTTTAALVAGIAVMLLIVALSPGAAWSLTAIAVGMIVAVVLAVVLDR